VEDSQVLTELLMQSKLAFGHLQPRRVRAHMPSSLGHQVNAIRPCSHRKQLDAAHMHPLQ
jgi:hypothetical protein